MGAAAPVLGKIYSQEIPHKLEEGVISFLTHAQPQVADLQRCDRPFRGIPGRIQEPNASSSLCRPDVHALDTC